MRRDDFGELSRSYARSKAAGIAALFQGFRDTAEVTAQPFKASTESISAERKRKTAHTAPLELPRDRGVVRRSIKNHLLQVY